VSDALYSCINHRWYRDCYAVFRHAGTDHRIERLKAENPQGSVVIQADKKATTDVLIKVMDASRAAGAFDVSIAAQEAS